MVASDLTLRLVNTAEPVLSRISGGVRFKLVTSLRGLAESVVILTNKDSDVASLLGMTEAEGVEIAAVLSEAEAVATPAMS